MKIGKFSVENPVLLNILMVALLALGGLSLSRLPREQFSEVPFYFVNILVPWPGVSAEDVEKQLVIPIEEEMQGLDDLDEISAVAGEGLAAVSVRFDDGISSDRFDKLFADVNTRFSRVELPDGTLQASVESFSSNDFTPVIEIVLAGDVGYSELVTTAESLVDPLRRINEVSGVDLVGVRDRQIVVSADRAALESRGIPLDTLVSALRSRNVNVPGGTLRTERRDYLVRTVGEVEDAGAFGEVVVRQAASGGTVRVRDVATIADVYDPDGPTGRFNGQPSITLRVTKIPGGSSVDIIDEVKSVIGSLDSRIPDGIMVHYLNDSSIPIQSSISVLVNNALFGLALLVVILYFFLGLRNALMAALGIPVTFAISFLILEAMGQTFNTNTLFGLVLVLGLIVDHAIVIIENSYRLQQGGLSRHQAAILGTDQVAIPVIAATATTVAAFLPLMILPGTIGKFLRVIPITVTVALLASTGEALFFLPSHFADWPAGRRGPKKDGRLFIGFRNLYDRILQGTYRRRRLTVILTLVIMVASFALVPLLQQDLFSAEDFSVYYIDITMPPGTPIEKTDRVASAYEERLLPMVGNGEVTGISTAVGFQSGDAGNASGTAVAQIAVDLAEPGEGRQRSIGAIMDEARALTLDIPGPDRVLFRKATNGPPTSDPVTFRIFGDSYDELLVVADRVRAELASEADILNIEDNYEPGKPELTINVNEERAAAYGLSVSLIGRYIRASVDGIEATSYFRDNESVDVVVRFDDADESSPAILQQLMIPTPAGLNIPFSAVASVVSGDSVASIRRLDGRRELTVTAGVYTGENLPEINQRIRDIFDSEYATLYPGIEFVVGGEFAEFNDLLIQILRIFLIGIFLIYLILGTQFKSYFQPFLILFSVPLAFAGVILYLAASGTPFSTTVLYAGVALAGIAVNDAIVLISFINEERAKGSSPSDAVQEAARTRLRPIILTSLTTIAGLAPTAIGLGGRSVVWGPMASTIIFGLLFSTAATLIFIPALYGSLFDRRSRRRKPEESE